MLTNSSGTYLIEELFTYVAAAVQTKTEEIYKHRLLAY